MSFGKIVVLSMFGAFTLGGGYSILADRHGLPVPYVNAQQKTTKPQVDTPLSSVKSVKSTPQGASQSRFRSYTHCSGSVRTHYVVDGDTLWHEGIKIRVADIDAPEVGSPKCSYEAALGAKATSRLLQLVNMGPFQMQSWQGRDQDKYGRKLRVLVRDGRTLGDILVSEGLARTWSGRREPWCK
ncbi:thermonuclease family protein [Rhizobium sp. CG4]|nr:thermonuclease family protein [Rhizobium sp. CG4]